MGIIIRQSIKTVIVTYAGIVLGFVNTLILYPLVLTQEQVGLTRTLINVAVLFSTFSALGAVTIPTLFFPFFKDPAKRHHGFLFFLIAVGMTGFSLFVVAFIAFQSQITSAYIETAPLIVHYLYYIIPFTFAVLFYNILETYTIVHQLPVVPNFLREVFTRGMITLGLALIFFGIFSFTVFVPWIVSAYLCTLLIILLYLKHQKILFLKPDFSLFQSKQFKAMVIYGGFAFVGNVSGAIIANIDGLLLSAYSGLKSTGIYAIAFFIGQVVEIPKRSLSVVLIPLVSEANKNNDVVKLKLLYKKSSINQLIVGGFIFLGLWVNIEDIFKLIPNGSIYAAGKWVVFYIGMAKLFDMVTGINAEIIGTSKFYKYDLVFYLFLSFIGIGANLLLIPTYGITGAAMASAISVLLFNSARYVFVAVIYKIQPFAWSTLTVIALGCGIAVSQPLLTLSLHPIINVIIRSIVVGITFIGGSILLGASEDINLIVKKVMGRIKHLLQIS